MPSRRVIGWPMFEPCRMCSDGWGKAVSSGMAHSGDGRERRCREGGKTLRRSCRGECERAYDDPARQLDLEFVVARRPGVGECGLRGATEDRLAGACADQDLLGCTGAPRLGRDATEREP